jgi:hypothetical protein
VVDRANLKYFNIYSLQIFLPYSGFRLNRPQILGDFIQACRGGCDLDRIKQKLLAHKYLRSMRLQRYANARTQEKWFTNQKNAVNYANTPMPILANQTIPRIWWALPTIQT